MLCGPGIDVPLILTHGAFESAPHTGPLKLSESFMPTFYDVRSGVLALGISNCTNYSCSRHFSHVPAAKLEWKRGVALGSGGYCNENVMASGDRTSRMPLV